MEGPDNQGIVNTPNQVPSSITQPLQYFYLQVQGEFGLPLAPALFAKDVIAGMFITQGMAVEGSEPPTNILIMSKTEVVIELSARTNLERTMVLMTALQHWLGQKVEVTCRRVTPEEVEHPREKDEEGEERESQPGAETQDAKFMRMMEDIHKLAARPSGEALRIPTFSGTVLIPKNEATFVQWIHEVREAKNRFPESTVKNWILRSLRGPPAEVVRSLGLYATVAAVLAKLETLHGAVAPLDVMMRKLYSMTQAKQENVTNYAIRLESTLANIQRDHPAEAAWINLDASKRDCLYLGLKKTYKESLRYLYDTGASFDAILKAASKAEAEAEHYKDSEPAPAKAAKAQELCAELMNEIAAIKAVANKAWDSQQKNQKQGKQAEGKKGGDGRTNQQQQKKGPGGACYGCGGTGHFIKECPNPHKKSLNSKGGQKKKAPPPKQKKEAGTSTDQEPTQEEETT